MFRIRTFMFVSSHICSLIVLGCSHEDPPAAENRITAGVGQRTEVESTAVLEKEETRSDSNVLEKLNVAHLPNAIQIHQKVISGGQPDGEEGFRELRDLGVRTIISVDGAKPDVELAKKYGMKYVHLPHSYDGIPDERAKQLAKAVRVLDGTVYIHCHHGKHRSPAAAAVACVAGGLIDPSMSLTVLKTAGTSENYRGLYQSAESARKLDKAILEAVDADFPEIASLPPLAEAMVNLEHTQDRLKEIAAAGWNSPPNHPDIDPAHEALLLKEHFTEMLRIDSVATEPGKFQEMLRDSENASGELEAALRQWKAARLNSPIPGTVVASFDRVTKNCTACHRQFRDIPLHEKRKKQAARISDLAIAATAGSPQVARRQFRRDSQ